MLVAPAVAARQFTDRLSRMLVLSALVGAAVGAVGALAATRAELPTGPVVVLVAVAAAVVALLVAPGRGVLWRARRLSARRARVRREAALLDLARGTAVPPWTVLHLRRTGHLDGAGVLTAQGRAAAVAAGERRALWTAWLAYGARLELPDAREPDPLDLPGSIGADAVARLRELAAGTVRDEPWGEPGMSRS
jgi:manganese/zinc/iron transport system permease protein